jgi:hypothetical protein
MDAKVGKLEARSLPSERGNYIFQKGSGPLLAKEMLRKLYYKTIYIYIYLYTYIYMCGIYIYYISITNCRLSFSFGRALQASALKAWGGKDVAAGQEEFLKSV